MSAILRTTLLYALVPVLFTVFGAAAGVFLPAFQRLRSHVLYLAAGVVFSVVAVELLPEIQRRALVGNVILGFALGIVTMLFADRILDRLRGDEDADEERDSGEAGSVRRAGIPLAPRAPLREGGVGGGMLVAVAIDFLLDGLLLGVGFAAGARIGMLLALAEAAEQLSVGLALAGELRASGVSRVKVLLIVSSLGMLVFVTAIVGSTVLGGLTGGMMETVLAFGVAALLYLIVEELLREAHEERETTAGTLMFFIGFLAFLVVGMVLE